MQSKCSILLSQSTSHSFQLKLPVFIFLLCVIHNVFGEEQQIKLEDIERDNLLSEKQTHINEALQIQQSQHVSAPGGIQYGSPIQVI